MKQRLMAQMAEIKDTMISTRRVWPTVTKFRDANNWTSLSALDVQELKDIISPLIVRKLTDESAEKFDLMMLNIELGKLCEEVDTISRQRTVCL